MLIDAQKVIRSQLETQRQTVLDLGDGVRTPLLPARYVPETEAADLRISLDGEWRVMKWPFRKSEETMADPKLSDAKWNVVVQPGRVFSWDPERTMEDVAGWNRVTLEHIDPDDGAMLRRRVRIPREWRGKRVFLRFDSIYPAGRVYVNGVLLGEHTSGLTPAEWDVTSHTRPGKEALIAVRLLRRHKFVRMDMPRHACEFAGLAQHACLFAVEKCHVEECRLRSRTDSTLKLGTLEAEIVVRNTAGTAAKCRLELVLEDGNGRRMAAVRRAVDCPAGGSAGVVLPVSIRNPLLWNDEYPNLYRARLFLSVGGLRRQEVSARIGFRRFTLDGGKPILNGRPVKFRGVNHLTYHPEHGLYTPEEWLRKNLALMKKANVNAIRTHYLGPRCLADLCDEMGIYLLQELPIDWGTNYIHDPEWVGPALHRIMAGIVRDRNHPSVMVWSIGNENMPESGTVSEQGYHHLRIFHSLARTLDPERPTMFPPPGPANKIRGIFEVRVGEIGDTHYSFNLAKDFLKTGKVTNPKAWTGEMETITREEAVERGWSGVWFSSEYGIMNMMPDLLNAPYLSIIDDVPEDPASGKNSLQVFIDRLRREWGFLRSEPSCLGGAYFPWLCAGIGDNPWGWVVWAEDNDWGVVTADLLPKPYFWAMRVLFSPVWFPEKVVWRHGDREIRFSVTNQFNAVDLSQCVLRTMMGAGFGVAGMRWKDIPVSCPPGETREISIPLWNKSVLDGLAEGRPALCRIFLLDHRGFRILTWDIRIVPESAGAETSAQPLAIGPDAVVQS